jgi:hypothetical protein
VEEWIDQFAEALGVEPVTPHELGVILKLARDVAHGVERKLAPVATFLAGVQAGREAGTGSSREGSLARAVEVADRLIPAP